MLQFFRKIRSRLLREGKTRQYFSYAVGEILLVVIGILIALQVNNWNEYRKDRIQEQAILQQLKKEYESNLEQLESKIQIRETLISSCQQVFHYMDHPEDFSRDSFLLAMSRGNYRPTFDPIVNDIVSSNKLQLIRNDRLRELLSQWESNVYQLTEEELFWKEYCIDNRLPFLAEKKLTRKLYYTSSRLNKKPYLLEHVDNLPVLFGDTGLEIDYEGLLTDPQLEAILTTTIFSATDANLISHSIRKYILEILEIVESEIR